MPPAREKLTEKTKYHSTAAMRKKMPAGSDTLEDAAKIAERVGELVPERLMDGAAA